MASNRELLYELLVFSLGILFILAFPQQNLLLAILLIGLYLLGNRLWHQRHDFVFYTVGAILGSIVNIIGVKYGIWTYAHPTVLGLPIWIPFGWGLGTVMLVRISENWVSIEKK